MADPGEEKDYKTTDPVGAANNTNRAEPLATEEEENYIDSLDNSSPEESISEKKTDLEKRPDQLQNVKSYATTRSGVSVTGPEPEDVRKKKPWYKKLNPLKRGPKPPVPKERIISREATAPFWSLLTFQWMSSLMSVGYRRTLEPNDIWLVNPRRKVGLLTSKVETSFKRRVAAGDRYVIKFLDLSQAT